ncbi:MAG: hypothetical protein PHU63_02205 [Candidatus ainarchaeum sp.]|nr:hypothetical protein [Candidatus ainarchaeum sp.]
MAKLQFKTIPPQRKEQMLKLVTSWKQYSGDPATLLEGLAILAKPGRVKELQHLAISDPHNLRLFLVDHPRGGYGERGTVEMEDAVRLLALVQMHTTSMPLGYISPELFAESLEIVARVLLNGESMPSNLVNPAVSLASTTIRGIDLTLATPSLF